MGARTMPLINIRLYSQYHEPNPGIGAFITESNILVDLRAGDILDPDLQDPGIRGSVCVQVKIDFIMKIHFSSAT